VSLRRPLWAAREAWKAVAAPDAGARAVLKGAEGLLARLEVRLPILEVDPFGGVPGPETEEARAAGTGGEARPGKGAGVASRGTGGRAGGTLAEGQQGREGQQRQQGPQGRQEGKEGESRPVAPASAGTAEAVPAPMPRLSLRRPGGGAASPARSVSADLGQAGSKPSPSAPSARRASTGGLRKGPVPGGPTGRDPSAQGNALGRVGGTASGKARDRSHEPSPMGWAEGTQAVGPENRPSSSGGEGLGEVGGNPPACPPSQLLAELTQELWERARPVSREDSRRGSFERMDSRVTYPPLPEAEAARREAEGNPDRPAHHPWPPAAWAGPATAAAAPAPTAPEPAAAQLRPFPGDRLGAAPALPDPDEARRLADLVNDALVEQARLHGVDLS